MRINNIPQSIKSNTQGANSPAKKRKYNVYDYVSKQDKELIDDFVDKVCGFRYKYIYKYKSGDEWATSNSRFPLGRADITKSVLLQDQILGTRCKWAEWLARIDIDSNSCYHPLEEMKHLVDVLSDYGLSAFVCQSSESTGYHINIPFRNAVSTPKLHRAIESALEASGYVQGKGQLEIFPPEDPNECAIRLPLQKNFAFLDQDTLDVIQYVEEIPQHYRFNSYMELFYDYQNDNDYWIKHLIDYGPLTTFMEVYAKHDNYPSNCIETRIVVNTTKTLSTTKSTESKPKSQHPEITLYNAGRVMGCSEEGSGFRCGRNVEVWECGREFFEGGLRSFGEQQVAVAAVSHYLFFGDATRGVAALGYGWESEREKVMIGWIDAKHHGFSRDYNQNPKRVYAHIKRCCTWSAPDDTLSSKVAASTGFDGYNADRSSGVKEKISACVERLKDVGISGPNKFAEQAGISIGSARKYAYLWDHLVEVFKRGGEPEIKAQFFDPESEDKATEEPMTALEVSEGMMLARSFRKAAESLPDHGELKVEEEADLVRVKRNNSS